MKKKDILHLQKVLNDNEIEVFDWGFDEIVNGKIPTELGFYTPAGEDFSFVIWHDGTREGFIDKFYDFAQEFDADEHTAIWVPMRGKKGCPSSIAELVEDAEAIQNRLDETVGSLFKELRKIENKEMEEENEL